MAVGIERNSNATVTEPFTHYLRMYALSKHQRGMGVPQIMEPNAL
jgi:hypothetical protein